MKNELLCRSTNNIGQGGKLFNKYKSSYLSAVNDLITHSGVSVVIVLLLWRFKHNILLSFMNVLLGALLLTRTFMIFHDCCHNAYSPNTVINYVLSHITGTFIMTSPNWMLDHNEHHLTIGKNDNGKNDNESVTINGAILCRRAYNGLSADNKQLYYLYKHPAFHFTVASVFNDVILQRYIYIYNKSNHISLSKYSQSLTIIIINHLINNVGILCLLYYCCKHQIVLHYLASLFIFISIKFMTLHNQHIFNPPYMVHRDKWSQFDSGLKGSSFIVIPSYLKYFYMGFEYHHIHHINAKIPGYNLQKYHEDIVQKSQLFDNVIKINMPRFYNNLWLALYDEAPNKYSRI